MLRPKSRPATYADIEALPANMVGQIIFGVLHTHPRPAPPHWKAAGELQTELNFPFGRGRGGPGGWIFAVEPELHLGPHVIVPDLAGWRRSRLPKVPGKTDESDQESLSVLRKEGDKWKRHWTTELPRPPGRKGDRALVDLDCLEDPGGTLVLADEEVRRDPFCLARLIRDRELR